MSGNLVQVGGDGKVRVKNNLLGKAGPVIAGLGDPCCCHEPCFPCPNCNCYVPGQTIHIDVFYIDYYYPDPGCTGDLLDVTGEKYSLDTTFDFCTNGLYAIFGGVATNWQTPIAPFAYPQTNWSPPGNQAVNIQLGCGSGVFTDAFQDFGHADLTSCYEGSTNSVSCSGEGPYIRTVLISTLSLVAGATPCCWDGFCCVIGTPNPDGTCSESP